MPPSALPEELLPEEDDDALALPLDDDDDELALPLDDDDDVPPVPLDDDMPPAPLDAAAPPAPLDEPELVLPVVDGLELHAAVRPTMLVRRRT